MLLDEIFERAENEGIEIDEINSRQVSAMSFPDGWIAVDRSKFESEAAFKTALAHELGHVETGSFYRIETPLYTKAKCEYKANKRAIQMLIPQDELLSALRHGIVEVWQLAEHFGVTEQMINRACCLYQEKIISRER